LPAGTTAGASSPTGYGTDGSGAGVDAGGALRLTRTEVSGNQVTSQFRAGIIGGGPSTSRGGGVSAAGAVTAVDSTVSGNRLVGWERAGAPAPDRVTQQVSGAGIFAGTTADLRNVTVSGNSSEMLVFSNPGPVNRGAVSAEAVHLVHATLTGNTLTSILEGTSPPEAGTLQAGTLDAVGSVVVPGPGQRACAEPVVAGPSSYTVAGDATCGLTGPGVSTDASGVALGPVADNGGPVPTQLPGAGSTLIDAVPDSPLPADARGVTRPQGPAADIGAAEVAQ
jgi:hypothetical protein